MSPTGDLLAGSHVHGDFEWPWPAWVARAAAVLPVATAFVAVWQRDAFWPVESGTVFAAVAVLPWLVEAVTLRHLPRWLFTGVVLAGVLGLVADPVEIDMSAFLLVFLAAEIACTASLRTGIAVALAAEAVLLYVEVFGIYDDSFPWVMGIAFGWAGGAAVGLQFRLLQESKASAAASAERAAVEERQRIAREVHDVVAHSLSAVMLHLTGVRRELETGGDPAEAASALREAEEVGREALADIRRTVGLLGPAGGDRRPAPTAADVPDLVARLRVAGLDLVSEIDGDLASVPPAPGLAVYRVAQEALANAAKHAPGSHVSLVVDASADPLRLVVANGTANGAPPVEVPGGGAGLSGMEERIAALGGTFCAGPEGDGWVVAVTVPRMAPEPA